MKKWKIIDWLSSECCGVEGAIQVETDMDDNSVCDGDRARCVKHDVTGTVIEKSGNMVIEWHSIPRNIKVEPQVRFWDDDPVIGPLIREAYSED